ncbi:MAG TPA: VOC family protein [Rhizobiaceae bacterium]|nr:VOC family protein [Rhizobiaceae bacterium]
MAASDLLQLEHVHVHATDMERMGAFLENGFGARLVTRRSTNGYDNWEYELGGIGLFLAKSDRTRVPGQLDHLGFRVTDIKDAIAHLQALGCTVEEGPVVWRADLTFAYLTGPEGLRIELLQRS